MLDNIPQDVLINLVDSMPHRCDAVFKANGYATNTVLSKLSY